MVYWKDFSIQRLIVIPFASCSLAAALLVASRSRSTRVTGSSFAELYRDNRFC